MFNQAYKGAKVLVTGNTGFKGAWLTLWLQRLGAEVIGFSNSVPTSPSLYDIADLSQSITQIFGDIRDHALVESAITEHKPDFVFHLAAQAIVSESYVAPLETISVNVNGTANVLDALRAAVHECVAVIITSDKCYENVEWPWGYKETDHLGGKDIYSASKGAAEIIYHAYFESFLRQKNNITSATARAGNVLGGGDWAKDRVVVDCIKSWLNGESVQIRSPDATRPWQHVLEPLSGYLHLGSVLAQSRDLNGESYNFGPAADVTKTVVELITDLSQHYKLDEALPPLEITGNIPFHEAGLLKLNCDKAAASLKWYPTLNYSQCVQFVGQWYKHYAVHQDLFALKEFTDTQIADYEEIAKERRQQWVR